MEKDPAKNKKITIDDLAVMMTRGFEGVYKEIAEGREETNELARMVANGFSSMDKKFSDKFDAVDKRFDAVDRRFDAIDKRIDDVEESIATTNSNVLSLGDRTVPRFEFDQHLIRFHNLEQKVVAK